MTTLETLFLYAEIGIPVFPMNLNEGRLVPAKDDWMKQILPSLEELTEWSEKYTAWGTVSGKDSGIIVVSVSNLTESETKLGCSLYSSMRVITPYGTDIYYKWTDELSEAILIDRAPFKFKDSGRIVILPPSKTPEGVYGWLKDPTTRSKSLLPVVPKEIMSLLDGVVRQKTNKDWTQRLDEIDSGWVKAKPNVTITQPKTTMEVANERVKERKYEAVAPKTGYHVLDSHIKGWIPGHLYVLTGETNSGKTAVACNFAYKAYEQGKKVTYFALEPDAGVIEYLAGIHHKKRFEDIEEEDLKIDLNGLSIFTKNDQPKLSMFLNTIEQMERQDLVIVDHIGYFTNNAEDRRSKTDQESEALKRIIGAAKKKKTAIMLIAHPRKPSGKNKKNNPLDMNEISGSASFKQDATDVLILHRDKDERDEHRLTNNDTGIIMLPKVKTGRSGTIKIEFVHGSPVMNEKRNIYNPDHWSQDVVETFK